LFVKENEITMINLRGNEIKIDGETFGEEWEP